LLDLAAQPGQFLSLSRTQAFLAGQGVTHIAGGLPYPILNGLRGDLELSGKLGWRSAGANQLDYLMAKFNRIGRTCLGHCGLLKIKILSVHEKESTPGAEIGHAYAIRVGDEGKAPARVATGIGFTHHLPRVVDPGSVAIESTECAEISHACAIGARDERMTRVCAANVGVPYHPPASLIPEA